MTYKITDIVAFISKHELEEPEPEAFFARLRAEFPGITHDEYVAAEAAHGYEIDAEIAEVQARYRRHQREYEEALHILEGLGKKISISEAVEIKAAQGDPIALRWQKAMGSKSYRLLEALGEAAHRAHPHFEQTPDHVWHWTGDGDMPSEDAMIDWFQMTHPTEARRIEAEIAGGTQ